MDEIECQELFLIIVDVNIVESVARGDALHLLDVLRKRHFRITQHLESGELAAVQAEVHGTYFDRRCIIGQEPVVSVSKARKVTSESPHWSCRLSSTLSKKCEGVGYGLREKRKRGHLPEGRAIVG